MTVPPSVERIGPYELRGELGRGGMGVVFRAWRADLGREFALKVIAAGAGSSSAAGPDEDVLIERFRREAAAGGRLTGHPGIVGIHDVGEDAGRCYIAMELVEGRPFDAYIEEGELAPAQVAALVRDMARAVQHAHDHGLLHRDIKPSNVLVTETEGVLTPRVTDFGLARSSNNDAELTRLTRSGEMLGTPAYMPPEQARGEPLDGRADVYALGACLYEALAGRPPFGGDSLYGVISRVLRDPPPPLRSVAPHVPEPLARVAACCLAKLRDERYATAGALADDLERFLAGAPVQARRPAHRVPRMRIVAGVLAGTGAALAAFWAVRVWSAAGSGDGVATQARQAATARGLAERAAEASAIYFAMTLQLRAEWQQLEDHWNGPELQPAELDAVLDAVRRRADGLAEQHPGSGQPAAWLAVGDWFAANRSDADREGPMRALRAAAGAGGDDPFPHLLHARALLAEYARTASPPAALRTAAGITLEPFVDSAEGSALREAAVEALAAAAASPLWPHLTEGKSARRFAAAAGELTAGRFSAAAAELDDLTDDVLLGRDSARLRGLALYLAGDFSAAAQEWEVVAVRGWLGASVRAAQAWSSAAAVAAERGADVTELHDRALVNLERAIRIGSNAQNAVEERAMLHLERAEGAKRKGEDPEPALRAALADADLVLRQRPDSHNGWQVRGLAWQRLSEEQRRRGVDNREAGRRALEAHEAVARIRPEWPEGLLNLATAHMELARADARTGTDVREAIRRAIGDLDRLMELRPGLVSGLSNRGLFHKELARAAARAGGDPMPHYDAAVADLRTAVERNSEYGMAAFNLGIVLVERGRRLGQAGADPAPGFREAIRSYDAAVGLNPRSVEAIASRGVAHRALGDRLRAQGEPFAPEWDLAAADYRTALELAPRDAPTWFNLGNLLLDRAKLKIGTPAGDTGLDEAVQAYDSAFAIDPRHWRGKLNAAVIQENRGRREQALAAYEAVLRVQPANKLALQRVAVLRR